MAIYTRRSWRDASSGISLDHCLSVLTVPSEQQGSTLSSIEIQHTSDSACPALSIDFPHRRRWRRRKWLYSVAAGRLSSPWLYLHPSHTIARFSVGTFSLYQALKMLGYTPYHMFEVVTNGTPHLQLFDEAIRCKYSGTGKPYGKAEFDKWLANYDVKYPLGPLPLFLLSYKK